MSWKTRRRCLIAPHSQSPGRALLGRERLAASQLWQDLRQPRQCRGLPSVLQEGEHALREQYGRACVVVGQAVVSEQVAIA
jgi:hypothetical protein